MRQRIGKTTSLVTREVVFQGDDAFEVETREHYEVVERRVLYDDVQLVTYHRELGTGFVIITGAIAMLFLIPAIGISIMTQPDGWIAGLVLALFGLPALIAMFLRLIFRVDIITIFGKRSKARLRFTLRKQKARETYGRICAIVRQAQGSGSP